MASRFPPGTDHHGHPSTRKAGSTKSGDDATMIVTVHARRAGRDQRDAPSRASTITKMPCTRKNANIIAAIGRSIATRTGYACPIALSDEPEQQAQHRMATPRERTKARLPQPRAHRARPPHSPELADRQRRDGPDVQARSHEAERTIRGASEHVPGLDDGVREHEAAAPPHELSRRVGDVEPGSGKSGPEQRASEREEVEVRWRTAERATVDEAQDMEDTTPRAPRLTGAHGVDDAE